MIEPSSDESLPEVPVGLFKDVKYYIIGKIETTKQTIERLLNAGGAKKELYLSDISTHCIADEDDDDEVTAAKEIFQSTVVKSAWVIKSIECGTLLPTSVFNPDCRHSLFKGLTICPSQISNKDNKVIWALVTCHGGNYQTRLTKDVTHLVTTSIKSMKYEVALMHSDTIKAVTPDWVTECVAQKTRIDEIRYHPHLCTYKEVLQTVTPVVEAVEVKQEVPVSLGSPDLVNTVSSVSVPFPTKPACISMKGMPTRPITSRQLTQQATALKIKDSVIGLSRQDFEAQLPQPPPATPLVLSRPTLLRPTLPLTLTLPVPPKPVAPHPPRQMLRNIANSSGSENRMPKNSQRANPTKVSPARLAVGMYPPVVATGKAHIPGEVRMHYSHDPGEHIPEDACLLGCVFYITDYQKYLEPATLDTWKQAINQFGGQVDDSYSNRITHVLCEHQKSDVFQLALRDGKRLVTAHWLNDCLLTKKMKVPWLALHFPFVFGKEKPCVNQIICVTNFIDEERDRIKHMITLLGAKYTGYMSRANSVLVAKRPVGKKYEKALEWRIPVVNVQWLNCIILGDLNALKLPLQSRYAMFNVGQEFAVDIDRVMHLLDGWKIPVKISKETWKKFQSSQILKSQPVAQITAYSGSIMPGRTNDASSIPTALKHRNDSTYDASPEKRSRLTSPARVESDLAYARGPVVLFTGIPRNRIALLAQEVERLGGKVASSTSVYCTHLITVAILRTVKFLVALNHVRRVVLPDWIEQSSRANRFLDESCFAVRDDSTESAFSFKLTESLRRASQRKVFQDLTFYLTPDVIPSKSILAEMIESGGGKVLKTLPPYGSIKRFVSVKGEPTFIVVSCEKDLYLCRELIHRNIGIQNSEFVITGIMRQELDYYTHRL